MDEVETEFLQTQRFKAQVWLKYIDNIFFIWTHCEENLYLLRKDLNNFSSILKFIFEGDRNSINFLDLNVKLKACVRYFLSNFCFSSNDSPSETMKNVFYFI